jgi:hypothetical protein
MRRIPERAERSELLKSSEVVDQERNTLDSCADAPAELLPSAATQIASDEKAIVKNPLGIWDSLKRAYRREG